MGYLEIAGQVARMGACLRQEQACQVDTVIDASLFTPTL